MIPNVDQLVKQLRQEGYVIFQLLSPEEAAGLNGLVRGIACRCGKHLVFELPLPCLADNIHNNALMHRPRALWLWQ